ncbi:MAG: hypothetical protein LQ338_007882 [Usnochroma carphineum]|nr:MAG: hypothetical protein LQ338_007882 [Usnochroma carphineum]
MDLGLLIFWTAVFTWSLAFGQEFPISTTHGYLLFACNAPHTRQLWTMIPQMISDLESTIADLEFGTASRHGFRSFFKTNANINDVRAVYKKMANAVEIYATNPDLQDMRPPAILCYDGRATDPIVEESYRKGCAPKPGQHSNIAALSTPATATIDLCDLFWGLRPEATANQCPLIAGNRLGRKLENTADLVLDQVSALIHEFAHLYNAHEPPYGYAESYNIQDAVDLNATESLRNAANYAYYVSGALLVFKERHNRP